ncbi:hypothetical protein L0Z26_15480 [Burkholderia multivorans]|nr:hypothetical protein [Burkholderia multivorans]MBU9485347.1 hypothetical protein [Burkholderia multivorans]MCO1343283.1 hypothetical protein [Burkholderia multivorans]MCO1442678.1 hypothetical protein [Burkholderia multivorans]UQO29473.1 hypothetical protein L0Z21_05410 [Burkholderia multivorans]UQO42758.1 hypothetical protein L0Z43_05905 [Burkholderia multivorans]
MDMVAPLYSCISFAAPVILRGGVPTETPGARCVFYAIPARRSQSGALE